MSKGIRIVYDKQCPACSQYCVLAKKYAQCEVELIDARNESGLMTEVIERGLDIDEGMVVELDSELHYGADAIHILAKIGPRKGVFNFTNRTLFKNARMAGLLYPMLRSCRNLLLKVLGIRRINVPEIQNALP